MSYLDVNVKFRTYYQFIDYPHIKVTKDIKIINTRTSKIIKHKERGYRIGNKYISKQGLKGMIEKIPDIEYCPF